MSVTAGSGCAVLAESLRHRTYAAAITAVDTGQYEITLGNAVFRKDSLCGPGRLCNRFAATRQADALAFNLFPDTDATLENSIWEWVSPGAWLEIGGTGTGRRTGSIVRGTLQGSLWHCPHTSIPCAGFISCTAAVDLTFSPE